MLFSGCQYFEKQYDVAAYVNDEEITVAGLDMFTLLAEYQIESLSSEEAFNMSRYGESDTLAYTDYKVYKDNQLNNLFIESYYTPDDREYIDSYIKLVLKRQKSI